MISYDNYKNRIEKLAKAKRIIHKFRFLIMGALALVIAASVGLMLAKGSYMSAMTLSAQNISFNESYEVTPAKAFLASARSQRVEYSVEGSDEWTTEKPVKAGKYLARTVSPKLVGYSYSTPVAFEITPLEASFEILGDSMVYGELPEYHATGLVSGHSVDTDALDFAYDNYGADSTRVDVVQSSFKIIDRDGEDFTSCYNVTFSGKQLEVTNRALTVQPTNKTVTYDGTVQEYAQPLADATFRQLAKGDEISFETEFFTNGNRVEEIMNAGEYEVRLTNVTVMHGNKNVTAKYDVTQLTAQFKVEKRKITVTTASESKPYDGKPLANTQVTSINLAEGHRIVADEMPSITDVGLLMNDFTVTIMDGNNRNVTSNYATPTYRYGTLEVTPCEVTVTTNDDSRVYDGNALYNYGFSLGAHPEGFAFSAIENGAAQIIDYGTVKNEFEVSVTATADGRDVTSNFKLSYVYGTLAIEKRSVTVTTGGGTRVFNGQPLSNDGFTVSKGTLVDGQRLVCDELFTVTDVTAAGGVDNTTTYKVMYGETDVSGNYNIAYVYGKLTVNVRRIIVYTNSSGRIYDGTPYSDDTYTTAWEEDGGELGLLSGELTLVSSAEITDFGSKPNACEFTTDDVNYEIAAVVPGTIEIYARPIVVKTVSAERVYNGEELSAPDYETTHLFDNEKVTGLIGDDKIALVAGSAPSILNTGIIDNDCAFTVPNANYEIVGYKYGELKVTVRSIIVTTATDSKEYDGIVLENASYTTVWEDDTTQTGLIGDDKLSPFSWQKVTQVGGPVDNVCSYYLPLFDGQQSNYEIARLEYGTLTITPRPIIVYTADDDKIYDGTPLKNTGKNTYYALETDGGEYEAVTDGSKAGLIVGDELTLVDFTEITDVGKEENVCHFKHENEFGRSNYDIHYHFGTLEVKVREIVVVTASAQKVYDGEALTAHTYEKTYLYGEPDKDGLLDGEILTPAGEPRSILNYGSLTNDCKFTVPNNNYKIADYDNGTLEILQREIKLITNGKEQVYNGQALSDAGYTTQLFGDSTQTGLIGEDKITVVNNPSITNAGEIDNQAENYVLPEFEAGETNYKIADYEYGKLTVLQRKIKLITNGNEQVYNGQPLSDAGYKTELFGDSTQTGLIGEDKITVVNNPSITNAGEIDNKADNYILPEFEVGKTNYGIAEYEYGKLVVTRAPLRITPLIYGNPSNYDRPALTYGDTFEYEKGIGNYRSVTGLVNDEQLEISVLVYASTDSEMPVEPKNAGRYCTRADADNCIVYDKDGNVIEGGIKNYEVSKYASGALVIERKTLNITIADQGQNGEIVYGDTIPDGAIPDGKFSIFDTDGVTAITNGSLPYSETLSITYEYYNYEDFETPVTPKDAGDYSILCKDTVLYDKDGNEIEGGDDNYLLLIKYSTLTIDKFKLELNLEEENLVYGIQPSIWYTANDPEGIKMPYGEVIRILVQYFRDGVEYKETDKFNRGAYEVVPQKYFSYDAEVIPDGVSLSNERDALNNYKIECANGVLNVRPKPIIVKIGSGAECTYGDRLPNATFKIYEYDFEGKVVEITSFPYNDNFALNNFVYKDGNGNEVTPKNVGVYTIAYNGATINLGTDGLDNYDIDHVDGTLTIKSKPLAIVIDDKTAVYGDALPKNTHTNTELVKGDTLTVEYRYDDVADAELTDIAPKNVGSYVIFVKTVKIGNEIIPCETEGYNYYITVTGGGLEITPRPITIVLEAPSNVYYGKTFALRDEIGNYLSLVNIGYSEQLKVALKYYDEKNNEVTPKNQGEYSAQLDEENCVFYEADGTTVIEGGLSNYTITCSNLIGLKIFRAQLGVAYKSFAGVQYGEWGVTQNYPTGAGNYEIANGLQYGEEFEIVVEYKYKSSNIELDRKPVDGLPKNVGEYYISAVKEKLKWYASDGSDIENGWDNYTIIATMGVLEIIPREIAVELKDLPDVRYGDILTKVNYPTGVGNYEKVETTAFGEQLKFSVTYQKNGVDVTPKNMGEYEIVPYGFTVYDKDGNKIEGGEKNYKRVGYTAGTLTIVPREIEAFFAPTDRVYGEGYPDTVSLSYLYDIEADGSLTRVNGLPYSEEELEFAFGYEKWVNDYHNTAFWFGDTTRGLNNPVTPRNVGTYAAVITGISVKNGSIDNYKVKINTTTFDVTAREIDVVLNPIDGVTYGASFTYNPNEAGLTYVNSPDLAYGEKLVVAVKYFDKNGNEVTPKNAGAYSAQIDEANCVVYEADGTTVIEGGIENYGITCAALENLEIKKKTLVIKIDDQGQNGEIVYGDKLPDNTFKIYDSINLKNEIENGDLPYGETIDFIFEYLFKSEVVIPKNAGSDYRISVDFSNLSNIIIDGTPCEYDNYAYGIFTGKLTISKKTLNITLTDKFTFVYGFNEFVAIDNVNSFVDEPYFATVEGEDITLGYSEQLYILVDYFKKAGVKCTPRDADEYTMRAKSYIIGTGDGASLDDCEQGFGELTNYIINCNDGKLTITRKPLTVTVDNKNATYGDALPAPTASITAGLDENGRLPYGEQENFDIFCEYENENGEALYQPNVGRYTIAFAGAFINLGEDVNKNYAITPVNGTLTVKQRDLVVSITDKNIKYGVEKGGVEYSFNLRDDDNAVILQDELHYGETLNVTFKYVQGVNEVADPQNVGEYSIQIATKSVTGGNGSIDNYNVRPAIGTLNISKKALTVEINGATSVYGDSVPHSTFVIKDDKGNNIDNGKLPYDESLDFVYSYKKGENSTTEPKAAGTYDITAKEVMVSGGNGSADNYNISYSGSPVLVITARAITVELNNGVQPQPFTYGEKYGESICNAKIEGLYGNQIIKVAVKYKPAEQTANVNGARSARTFAARLSESDETFIPRHVGTYIAELDWDNCQLFESDGVTKVEGGMANYALQDGFECAPVTFTIVKKLLNVTIENSHGYYGDKLPLEFGDIYYETDVTPADYETLELTFAILDDEGNPAKNVGTYPITVTNARIFNSSLGEKGKYEEPTNYDIKFAKPDPVHEIKPREINVTYIDQFVTYGETPSYPDSVGNYVSIGNRVDGEDLKIAVTYKNADGVCNANPTEAGTYDIVYASFEVYDKDGNKIEGGEKNYSIVGETGTLEISSRVITVKSGSARKIYDGTALTSDNIDGILSGLTEAELAAKGYRIVADEKFGQIHVTGAEGVDNTTSYKVVDGNGDATENYVVTVAQCGKFIVTARPISITTDSATRDYNGEELTAGYTVKFNDEGDKEPLGEGDSFSVTKTSGITNAGSTPNAITYIITNADGEDVTKTDYSITYTEGTLTVNQLAVKITLGSVTAQYGEKFDITYTLDCGSLPNGETLGFEVNYLTRSGIATPEVSDYYFILARGMYTISLDENSCTVDGEADKALNYNFSADKENPATLTVERRQLKVTTNTSSHTYDGAAYTDAGFTVVWAKDNNYAGLLGDDALELTGAIPSVTDAGAPVENALKFTVPSNYAIAEQVNGSISIDRRVVGVQTADIDGDYDGSEYSDSSYKIIGNVALVYGHTLEPLVVFSRADATGEEEVENTTTFKVMSGNTDVSHNYTLVPTNGKVVIRQRELSIKTNDITEAYDGTAHYDAGFEWEGEIRPVLDHELQISHLFTWTNATVAGAKQNTNTYKVVGAAGDVTSNYNINVNPGTVTISQARVTVTLADVAVDYGDNSYTAQLSAAATKNGVARYETLNLAFEYSDSDKLPNNGVYTVNLVWNNCTVTGGEGLLSNYCLAAQPDSATLTINKKRINVTINGTECNYGEALPLDKITYSPTDLANGESLALTFEALDGEGNAARNAGEYDVTVKSKAVTGGSLNNYDITYADNSPKLTIKAIDIAIELDDLQFDYNNIESYPAQVNNYKNYGAVNAKLAYNERLQVVVGYERNGVSVDNPRYAGEYNIVLKDIIVYAEDGSVIDGGNGNYSFLNGYTGGTLTINGISLVITHKPYSKPYDDEPIKLSDLSVEDQISYYYVDADGVTHTQFEGEYAGYSLRLTDNDYATESADARSYENGAEYAVYYGEALDPTGVFVVTYNNETDGKLTITQREIVVVTAGESKVYDGEPLEKTDGYMTYLYGDVNADGLIGADALTVDVKATRTDAGESANTTTYTANGNYKIVDYKCGTLTVEKRKIKISTVSNTHVYDGAPFSDGRFETVWADDESKSGLVGSDKLTLVGSAPSIENVGTVRNTFGYELPLRDDGETNYEVVGAITYGTLTVTARRIVVVTADLNEVYNGKPHKNAAYVKTYLEGDENAAGLLNGATLTADSTAEIPSIINVGTLSNNCKFIAPDNYEIANYVNGTLTVTQKPLKVTLSMEATSYAYGDLSVKTFTHKIDETDCLVAGENLTVKLTYKLNGNIAEEPRTAGSYTAEINLTTSAVTHSNGTDLANGIGNYAVTCNTLSFTIEQKNITVNLAAWANEVYNGKAHEYNGSASVVEGLEYGETITSIGLKIFTNAAKTDEVEAPVNAGTYYVELDASATLLDTLQSLDTSYNVMCDGLTFVVEKSELEITLSNSLTQVYNGASFDFATATDAYGVTGLAEGEQLEITVRYEQNGAEAQPKNAGTYDVIFVSASIVDNENGMDNYDLVTPVANGSVQITKRKVSLTVADRIVEKGGERYGANDITAVPDFVTGELEAAVEAGEITFDYIEITENLPDGATAQYTVSLVITEKSIMSNYDYAGNIKNGTLTVTNRHVLVAPKLMETGRIVYTGEALSSDLFGFGHAHISENELADDDLYGFEKDDLDNIQATFAFVDGEGKKVDGFPVKAGTYSFTVKLSGTGIKSYLIEYSTMPAFVTIDRRSIDVSISYSGENTHVYDGKTPDLENNGTFSVINEDTTDGFVNGDGDNIKLALRNGSGIVGEFTDVGKYTVCVNFKNIENYYINAVVGADDNLEVEITKRIIVVLPVEPSGGLEQYYNGKPLALDSDKYVLVESDGVYGLAEDDAITVISTELSPTTIRDYVWIDRVEIYHGDRKVTDNYDVHCKYNANDRVLIRLGVAKKQMQVAMSYKKFDVAYNQEINGVRLPYTGAAQEHDISGTPAGKAVTITSSNANGVAKTLFPKHSFVYSTDKVTVSATAGTYENWLAGVLRVFEGDMDVTVLYNFTCANAGDLGDGGEIYNGKPIIVVKNTLTVTLKNVTVDILEDESAFTTSPIDNNYMLKPEYYEVGGLLEKDGVPVHTAEVLAFKVGDRWLLGVTVFRKDNNRRTDMLANYDQTEIAHGADFDARYIAVSEISTLLKPVLNLEINVTADQLKNGYGTVFVDGGIKGSLKLSDGYYSHSALKDGDKLEVLVFRDGENYKLGVAVYRDLGNGRYSNARDTYNRTAVTGTADVAVEYINVDNIKLYSRDLYIDLSGTFDENGDVVTNENGEPVFTAHGLFTDDVAQITVTKTADGEYTVTVKVVNAAGTSRTGKYEMHYFGTLPAGVTVKLQKAV